MLNRRSIYHVDEDEDDLAYAEDEEIQWSNIIFLPFNPTFKFFVLISVIIKSILGPIQSVYPIVNCSDVMDRSKLTVIKYLYWYFCDPIYVVDTFIHMVHRQVTEIAMRREYLPKSLFLIILDIIAITPFIHLLSSEVCPPVKIWPNILNFTEFLVIYRIAEYFSMVTTHSYWRLSIGYTLIVFISINCLTCFLLLLTSIGLCPHCNEGLYDWRKYVFHRFNGTDDKYATYIYGASIIFSYVIHQQFDETKASTYIEFILMSIFMMMAYFILLFVIFPKMFAEAHLNLKRICTYHPIVQRIIQETKRRNPSPKAHLDVKDFYSLMWKKRGGITSIPEVISELPKYLRVDIRQDLVWPIFYHSPTFRRTSTALKRWMCEHVRLDYKLPGERFFAGPHCHTHLFYLKTGIVQIISADDGVTPLLSVTSGTLFGDISFFLPPMKRKIIVRCLTYCEVFYLTRFDILISLHMFPVDRRMVIESAKGRIKHARTLYTCKQHVRGLDRSEDEGIDWVKRRWWQISKAVSSWKQKSIKKEIPAEEAVYHCSKYIGQIVLCTEAQLQITSMFTNVKFPWIFAPQSTFGVTWRRIVVTTVYFVVILYPPCLTRVKVPIWFPFFQLWTDIIYAADIFVTLLTSTMRQENTIDNFAAVMFARCKSAKFVFDLLSTIWIENLAVLSGLPSLYYPCQFNRLIKMYILCPKWHISKNPFIDVCHKQCLIQLSFMYIIAYVIYLIDWYRSDLSIVYFFGEWFCKAHESKEVCHADKENFFDVYFAWIMEFLYFENLPSSLTDIYVVFIVAYLFFLIYVYCQTNMVAGLYLKYRETANFQYFVSNIKNHYQHYKLHPGLYKRLQRYLVCHWKYYKGMDVMHPELLKNEPYDIWFKVHGEVAENIIKQSSAFINANPAFIKELAYRAKFLILPKKSTIFLFGIQCKTMIWSVQGYIKCEYHNEKGELIKTFFNPGELLSTPSVFVGKPSLRTLVADTECEVLYLKIQDFFAILKHYPSELVYFETCIRKFSTPYTNIYQEYANKYKEYQSKLRDKILNAAKSRSHIDEYEYDTSPVSCTAPGLNCLQPNSPFIKFWMLIRAVTVAVSIMSSALQGGCGAPYRSLLASISVVCDIIAVIDIIIKSVMGYYDERGLLITGKPKCCLHYLTHGFILDMIGVLPIYQLIKLELTKEIDDNTAMFITTLSKFAHMYLLTGYFDYIADTPTANMTLIMISKWQVVTIFMMFAASHYFVNKCINFHWDSMGHLSHMTSYNNCWLPRYIHLDETPSYHQLKLVFAESLNLAQSGLMRVNLGRFKIARNDFGLGFVLFILGFTYWYVVCYSLTLMVLSSRGNTIFQHGVSQLRQFLQAERVEKSVMDRAIKHFSYWWLRTKGINMQNLMNERIGIIFRQDLSHYLFNRTFAQLNTILNGSDTIERDLCSAITELYFLPGEEIIREMDLAPWIYIVHRGKIVIKKNDTKVAVLTKGSIFGQITGMKNRPARISAQAVDHADVLQIPFQTFRDAVGSGPIRQTIDENSQSVDDYMATDGKTTENPYNTVQYILRGTKAIKLPGYAVTKARNGTWYSQYLFVVWFVTPTMTTAFTAMLKSVPPSYERVVYLCLYLQDIVHLMYFITEFFTIELVVEDGKCVERTLGWRHFKKIWCYADILSLVLPCCRIFYDDYHWGYARFLRVHVFYDFHRHFCTGFKSRVAPILLNISIIFLTFHAMTCAWMYIACKDDNFPVEIPPLPPHIKETVDYSQWVHPDDRIGGCAIATKSFGNNGSFYDMFSFLVPKDWRADYVVAMSYILIIYTQSELDAVVAINLGQVYFKVIVTFCIYLVNMWILSIAISAIYTKLRNLYRYDYSVIELLTYLDHNGLSPVLLDSVREYTKQLWKRQKGNWLPELAQQAPQCLREDILSALYIHHLQVPPVFRDLPAYFIRQLVTRLHRVVVFPGKLILQEGDIYSAMYFIHEGEVEKWHTDKSGEKKLLSILTANGYFGLIPGLFPNSPFHHSYYSRTVVDLVVLRYRDWQDLLHGYPQIKQDLYAAAKQFRT